MPNRIIKESICTSENLNQLSVEAENLFYRLIVKADDFGCYYGNVKIVKNTCYPLRADSIKDKQITSWLNELVNADLIIIYQAADGKQYIKLTKWEKHQQKRATRSKFPTPDDENMTAISNDINCNQLQSNVPEKRETRNEKRETRNEKRECDTGTRAQKSPNQEKVQFAENVSMTNAEYEKLISTYGEANTARMIEKLDNYKGSTGRKYKSDYRTILNWVSDEVMKKNSQPGDPPAMSKNVANALQLVEKYSQEEGECP